MLRFIIVLLVVLSLGSTNAQAGWLANFNKAKVGVVKASKVAMLASLAFLVLNTTSCDDPAILDVGQLSSLLLEQGDGDTAAVIKIGLSYDGSHVPNAKDGAELAVEEINAAGDGVLIELVAIDNMDSLAQSIRLTTSLLNEHEVHALIGPGSSVHAIIAGEIAQRFSVPMVTTAATNPEVTNSGRYVFMSSSPYTHQGELMAKFAVEKLASQTAAVLIQSGDVYSEGTSQAFTDNFTLLGGEVVTQQFYAAEAKNFGRQVLPILAQKPDVVYMPGGYGEAALAVKQARELGVVATFLGGDGWDDADLLKNGGEALEGSFFSGRFHATPSEGMSDGTVQFIENFTAQHGVSPNFLAASGYDTTYLVAQAITQAGSLEGEAIKEALAATTNYSAATVIHGFTKQRHALRRMFVKTVKGGVVEFYQLVEPE